MLQFRWAAGGVAGALEAEERCPAPHTSLDEWGKEGKLFTAICSEDSSVSELHILPVTVWVPAVLGTVLGAGTTDREVSSREQAGMNTPRYCRIVTTVM